MEKEWKDREKVLKELEGLDGVKLEAGLSKPAGQRTYKFKAPGKGEDESGLSAKDAKHIHQLVNREDS